MLPKAQRLTRAPEFTATVRRGTRAGAATLVVHLLVDPPLTGDRSRAGFVVAKSVGGAVVRNSVTRRLRALVAARIDAGVPAGSWLVVRALPPSATASSDRLATDLDAALASAVRRSAGARQAAGATA